MPILYYQYYHQIKVGFGTQQQPNHQITINIMFHWQINIPGLVNNNFRYNNITIMFAFSFCVFPHVIGLWQWTLKTSVWFIKKNKKGKQWIYCFSLEMELWTLTLNIQLRLSIKLKMCLYDKEDSLNKSDKSDRLDYQNKWSEWDK